MQFGKLDPQWSPRVLERLRALEIDDSEIQYRLSKVNASVPVATRNALLTQAARASSVSKRVMWLRKEADALNAAATPLSGCATGCAHCCHIGVMVLASEASVIGKEIGVKPLDPPIDKVVTMDPRGEMNESMDRADVLAMEFVGQACTFLQAGRCSIYSSRPMACRQQFNMDVDGLLCELAPGGAVPVPYLDVTTSKAAYVIALGSGHKMADIRHFFPPAIEK